MKLDHVKMTMPTGQEAAARAFFIGIFNMQELPKPTHLVDRGGCWFKNGSVVLHIGAEDPFGNRIEILRDGDDFSQR
ncbi:MAG: hypothetical protein AAGB06_03780 [Verrucomicrobiota bacterium]